MNTAVSLQPRQLEVLRLAARGMTNREIGHELLLSANTVSQYAYEGQRLLGVRRWELGAALTELGLSVEQYAPVEAPKLQPRAWDTRAELVFISQLGRHFWSILEPHPRTPRSTVLQTYRDALVRWRTRWESVDPRRVFEFIDASIAFEQGTGPEPKP